MNFVAKILKKMGFKAGSSFFKAYKDVSKEGRKVVNQNSKKGKKEEKTPSFAGARMMHDEALNILNFKKDEQLSLEMVKERFDDYLERNKVTEEGGGSIYLQAKIKNARDVVL